VTATTSSRPALMHNEISVDPWRICANPHRAKEVQQTVYYKII
jgi:hypothetical protein